ncbi:hypothetical protein LINGRAHAP2_LOCUS11487 [Linum grandiflorum]
MMLPFLLQLRNPVTFLFFLDHRPPKFSSVASPFCRNRRRVIELAEPRGSRPRREGRIDERSKWRNEQDSKVKRFAELGFVENKLAL